MQVKVVAEVVPHEVREWMAMHADAQDRILLDTEHSNANNEVDRYPFLNGDREVIPGCCRWLKFGYLYFIAKFVYSMGKVSRWWTTGRSKDASAACVG